MPEITDQMPRETVTIAGKSFQVPAPFAEGHVLKANEAAALNQTFAENVRNNFASKVKEAIDAGTFDEDIFQSQLNEYVESYEFGARGGGGGRTSDPVEAESLDLARGKVREALKAKGIKVADVKASEITVLAKQVLAKYPQIREVARQRVAATQEVAAIELDSLDSAGESEEAPASEETTDAPATSRRRGAAADTAEA